MPALLLVSNQPDLPDCYPRFKKRASTDKSQREVQDLQDLQESTCRRVDRQGRDTAVAPSNLVNPVSPVISQFVGPLSYEAVSRNGILRFLFA